MIFRLIYLSSGVKDFITMNKCLLNRILSISFEIKCSKSRVTNVCDVFFDLVPFIILKTLKTPMWSVTFSITPLWIFFTFFKWY